MEIGDAACRRGIPPNLRTVDIKPNLQLTERVQS